MTKLRMISVQANPVLKEVAASWFHEKWGIPYEAYLESIEECLKKKKAVPQWYLVLDTDKIVGGAGVIENDFHDRKDLAPNVCAVYVEEDYRCQGLAGELLDYICKDMLDKGVETLYLVTEHHFFYERYGWKFLCMVQGDGEDHKSRLYYKTSKSPVAKPSEKRSRTQKSR